MKKLLICLLAALLVVSIMGCDSLTGGSAASKTYTVTVVSSIEHGKVTASKTSGIKAGDIVTLTIKPDTGYVLDTLTVTDASSDKQVSVTGNAFAMPSGNVIITASFKSVFSVTVASGIEHGTVKVDKTSGITAGETVTLAITPETGYVLSTLTVKDAADNAVTVTDNTFTMPADNVTVSATFSSSFFTLTVAGDIEHGTVSADKTGRIAEGDIVTLTLTPDTGYVVARLTVKDASDNDVVVTDNTFTMPASDVSVSAVFSRTYSVIVSENITHGTVSAGKTKGIAALETVTLTIIPDSRYKLATISVKDATDTDVDITPDGENYTFSMPSSNVTVAATFGRVYSLTVDDGIEHGTVTADASGEVAVGRTVTLTVTPDDGYALTSISVKDASDNDVTVENNTFTMPSSDLTVSAAFHAVFSVTVSSNEHGTVSASKTSGIAVGETITLTETLDDSWVLERFVVKDALNNNIAVTNSSFTMPSSNVTVSAVITWPYIGTKSPTAAKSVGDIVFKDGSATPYAGNTLTDAQKAAAVAVIFYSGTECTNDDDLVGGQLRSRTLGVGLVNRSMRWCSSPDGNTNEAQIGSDFVPAIECNEDKDPITKAFLGTFSGTRNGSNNLALIAEYLRDTEGKTDDAGINPTNYPAFYFAKYFVNQTGSHVRSTMYETGWYLPSLAELYHIRENRATVNAALSVCGGDILPDKEDASKNWAHIEYWSSSIGSYRPTAARTIDFAEPSNSGLLFKPRTYSYRTCVIHEF